jgi:hypothetical protein
LPCGLDPGLTDGTVGICAGCDRAMAQSLAGETDTISRNFGSGFRRDGD